MQILFIQTGGTIDKEYPRMIAGYAFEIGEAAVKRVLAPYPMAFTYEILPLLRKDRLDLTDDDRELIQKSVKETSFTNIIITHGTDTLLETAASLETIAPQKVIILTGAYRPERFKESDAAFNIGVAVGALPFLPSGVYIAMNGRVSQWQKVTRELKSGKFLMET